MRNRKRVKERKREREQRNIFISRKKKNKLTEMKERQTVGTEGQTGRWIERQTNSRQRDR